MKILHTADLHGDLRWLKWLRKAAAGGYDLVTIAGDLLDQFAGSPPPAQQAREMGALIADFPAPLALCGGNHDHVDHDPDRQSEWIRGLRKPGSVWVDGDVFEQSGHRFRCIGYGDPIPTADPEEIWITHVPPQGTKPAIDRFGVDRGDDELGAICVAGRGPELALCGHVHQSSGWYGRSGRTVVVNAGFTSAAAFPSHVVIDLSQGIATHRRFMAVDDSAILWRPPAGIRWSRYTPQQIDRLVRFAVRLHAARGQQFSAAEIAECRRWLLQQSGHGEE
jgi:Icc-related predicted phosphoesterase